MSRKFTPTIKAYKNTTFLNSSTARNIRILCEHEETQSRLEKNNIFASVLIFGSARAKSFEEYEELKNHYQLELDQAINSKNEEQTNKIQIDLTKLETGKWMCEYYEKIYEVSKAITLWSLSNNKNTLTEGHKLTGCARVKSLENITLSSLDINDEASTTINTFTHKVLSDEQSIIICTGGGPGFMEAANKGAWSVPGARSMGMGITLPFEEGLNPYVTEELAFQYHYFFTRKFWMVYNCQALIVAPGGVGTLDELFEVLTLKQTGKIQKDLPVVLFGSSFWKTVVNWDALVNFGTVSRKDVDDLYFTDCVDDAVKYIISKLTSNSEFSTNNF